ncbi:MAG: ClpXP protease specificity-enhancing factor SspB [Rickettsiales bacterium]|nr:ClpXP protease specificity-enhancing factor SspB [Rickettsiales bacterium]
MKLDYGVLVEKAFRGMIRSALKKMQKITDDNLCFLLVIDTKHKDVLMPEYLKAQYPQNMAVILQHKFVNLRVYSSYFSVELSFGGKREDISIPFGAIMMFNDKTSGMELVFETAKWTDPTGDDCDYVYSFGFEYEEKSANIDTNFRDNLINFENIKNR